MSSKQGPHAVGMRTPANIAGHRHVGRHSGRVVGEGA